MREEGWVNDLNGLVHHDGEFHLFAQRWNRCWIHAVSTDLIHWTELQPAFWEDHRFGGGVQSGGAVIDYRNTSGLSPDPRNPAMVAFWSGNDNFSTCISYSLDKGRTWTKYARNPVLRHPERDPKVFWHEPTRRWVLVLSGGGAYFLFTSPDLLNWTELKEPIPRSFECPDMFPLHIVEEPDRPKWVLVRGNGHYSVGEFDGARFREETGQRPCDHGASFYATMSWGEIAGQPGRRVQAAWMRCDGRQIYPDMPFNQQISFPCDLTLHRVNGSLRLYRKPVPEIERLHRATQSWKDVPLQPGREFTIPAKGELVRILTEVDIAGGSEIEFRLRGMPVVATDRSLACNSGPAATAGPVRMLEILVDRTSIESFANDGEVSISTCFVPNGDKLAVSCTRGSATVRSLTVFELAPIWDSDRHAVDR
jgi:sucrose-6-phosphate hydrolase SacC (GH32 family)